MSQEQNRDNIQQGYRKFLKYRHFDPRFGQKQMIAEIANTLSHQDPSKRISVMEAGTGIGKTIAYLIAAMPIAHSMNKKLVVATGTVALQEQLIKKDLPELMEASGWDYSYSLMKGRGRYLCNLRMEQCLDAVESNDRSSFLFDDENFLQTDKSKHLYRELSEAFGEGIWDGDRDSWRNYIEDIDWRALTVDRRQCTGRRCRYLKDCAFFKARSQLEKSDCIVVNHDLVMADIALGGGVIMPPLEDSIYVFDEAHRVNETAVRHFGSGCHIEASGKWLETVSRQCKGNASKFSGEVHLIKQLSDIGVEAIRLKQLLSDSYSLCMSFFGSKEGEQDTYRFDHGDPGDQLRNTGIQIAELLNNWSRQVELLIDKLNEKLVGRNSALKIEDIENLYQKAGHWLARAERMHVLWHHLSREKTNRSMPWALWVSNIKSSAESVDVSLNAYPICSSEMLSDRFWGKAYGVIMTSATLRTLGNFDILQRDVGVPPQASYKKFSDTFDYTTAAVLRVPINAVEGSDVASHTRYLIDNLETMIDDGTGTLVLFSSRNQMLQVFDGISVALRQDILLQGQYSNTEMQRLHKKSVDVGNRSVLFGLATLAEGIDLPGDYCRHVIIVKLPFSVPNDPQHEALCEWIEAQGGNAFTDVSLPLASLRLIQSCGRLLRHDTDDGIITILDRRLVTKRYGSRLLDSLPPFKRDLHASNFPDCLKGQYE